LCVLYHHPVGRGGEKGKMLASILLSPVKGRERREVVRNRELYALSSCFFSGGKASLVDSKVLT